MKVVTRARCAMRSEQNRTVHKWPRHRNPTCHGHQTSAATSVRHRRRSREVNASDVFTARNVFTPFVIRTTGLRGDALYRFR